MKFIFSFNLLALLAVANVPTALPGKLDIHSKSKEKDSIPKETIGKSQKEQTDQLIIPNPGDRGNTRNIWQAAKEGSLPAVVFYVNEDENNINKKNKDDWDKTPLMWASWKGHLKIVEYLVSSGAEVDAVDYFGYTALMRASRNGHTSTVEYLIKQGAKVNQKHIRNDTSLHEAVFGNHLEVVKLLIENGADKSLKDEKIRTPLAWAKKLCRNSISKYLSSI